MTDAEHESRPQTADVNKMEQQSQYMVARVMSATDRRVRKLQEDSEANSAVRPASAQHDNAANAQEEFAWSRAEYYVGVIMATWKMSNQWKYCLKRRQVNGTAYAIEALFSIPTRRRPIPNATASVFFTLDPGTRGFVKPKVKENAEDIEEDTDAPAKIRIDKTKTDEALEEQAVGVVELVVGASDSLVNSIIDDASRPGSTLSDKLLGVDITYTMEQQQLVHGPRTVFKQQWLDDILVAKRLLFGVDETVLGDEDPLAR